MKKLILFSVFLLLFSCSKPSVNNDSIKDEHYSNDLVSLLNYNSLNKEEMNFNYFGYKKVAEDHTIYTFKITYKSEKITNFKMMVLPLSYTVENNVEKVSKIGYYDEHSYTLTSALDISNLEFTGFELGFKLSNNDDGIKVLIRGDDVCYKLALSSSELVDEIVV